MDEPTQDDLCLDDVNAFAGTALAADQAALDAIQAATGGKMKAAKGKVFDSDCGEEIEYEAEAIDLNGDGQLEVMTMEFGSCWGRAGSQMNLYIKDKGGKWQPQFGFPGSPKILTSKNHGFPDVEVAGPGTCFPVWRYNGKQYDIFKSCP